MYLSKLVLNLRNKGVRRDLANPHDLHRTILRAFPNRHEGGPGRVLFRLENATDNHNPVLVQSQFNPDWSRLVAMDGYLIEESTKHVNLILHNNQRLRFRIRANPTVRRAGKRHGLLQHEDQHEWLKRKGCAHGFDPDDVTIRRSERLISRRDSSNWTSLLIHYAVEFEGTLIVTEAQKLLQAIDTGIGAAKAYGFGLLSVAKA